ncbi:hypothetical protein MVEG_11776 [Podila verticillata NRRL 6337]|uniref:Uncharacterized protein n=1 Tax=Podila verticillata NRRL 6337 TaxID=1069443 RepID=A0A086TJL0_9FUNG|nr:hypothetical protein MVEG_11776 [Podila verticillata NRRL 6337]
MLRYSLLMVLFVGLACATMDQFIMQQDSGQPRGTNQELVDAVTRHYSQYFTKISNPFLPDVNYIEDDFLNFGYRYRIPTSCTAYVKGPDLVPKTTGIHCDIDSPAPCVKTLEYTHTQTFATSRSVTNSIGISLGATFKAFSLGLEASSSVTNTVTHEWSNGHVFRDEFSAPAGKSCVLKIATYSYMCDYEESFFRFQDLGSMEQRSRVEGWYATEEPQGTAARIPIGQDGREFYYLFKKPGNTADLYICNSSKPSCTFWAHQKSRWERTIRQQSNPTSINDAVPGLVSCIIA